MEFHIVIAPRLDWSVKVDCTRAGRGKRNVINVRHSDALMTETSVMQ